MKAKKLIYVFVFILTGLLITAYRCYAEPTVKEILEKKLSNDLALQTFEAKVTTKWNMLDTGVNEESVGYIWTKGKDKQRIEIYNDSNEVIQTQIVNGQWSVLIDEHGEQYQMKQEIPEEPLPLSEGELINEDVDKFLEYFNVNINSSKSNNGQNIYCLEIRPTSKSAAYNSIEKIEEYIDYEKGMEIKNIIYTADDEELTIRENKELKMIEGIWVPMEKVNIFTLEEGNKISNTVKYEEVKINQDIDNEKFEIETE